jgi:3-dehydroquinate synthase
LLAQHVQEAAARGAGGQVITDSNVWALWGEAVGDLLQGITRHAPPKVLPPGETSKEVRVAAECWEWLAARGVRRDGIVIAVGGGVVGDLAGFVAASYLRGIRLWQVPTSLLAQVDASVGGKCAVNLQAGKNLVGAFYQPELVIADTRLLSTLPREELVNGLGEVVKYGLLQGQPLFTALEERAEDLLTREPGFVDWVVEQCVRYKAEVVDADEKESGPRAVLNLGHTVGHALETAGAYRAISHGRAVALGLLAALALSERMVGLDPSLRVRTRSLLARLGLPTSYPVPAATEMRLLMERDKKASEAGAGFVGLQGLGDPLTGLDPAPRDLEGALDSIRSEPGG